MRKFIAGLFALVLSVSCAAADFGNPGPFSLGDIQVGVAGTYYASIGPTTNLSGITALTCQVRFFYGSGGSTVQAYIQTSIDQGSTWFDIAAIGFTTSAGTEIVNLSGLNGVTTPVAPVSLWLSNNTTFNGPLGDRFQLVVVSTGIYSGQTLVSGRCVAR